MAGNGEEGSWAADLKPRRIEALRDGVFAIAMTLLAVELSVPDLLGTSGATGQPTSLLEVGPEFYSYALSFVVLGVFWIMHHYMFHFIRRSDGILVWLNVLFLMLVALIPFSTKLLNSNPGDATAAAFYGSFVILTNIVLVGMWYYVTRRRRFVSADIDRRVMTTLPRVLLLISGIMLAGVILGYLNIQAGGVLMTVGGAYAIVATARARRGHLL